MIRPRGRTGGVTVPCASSWQKKCKSSRSILLALASVRRQSAPARRSDGRRPPSAIRPTAQNSPDSPPPVPSSAFAGAGTATPNDVEFKARASEHSKDRRAHGAQEPSRWLVRRTHPIPPPLFVEQRRADAIPLVPAHRPSQPCHSKNPTRPACDPAGKRALHRLHPHASTDALRPPPRAYPPLHALCASFRPWSSRRTLPHIPLSRRSRRARALWLLPVIGRSLGISGSRSAQGAAACRLGSKGLRASDFRSCVRSGDAQTRARRGSSPLVTLMWPWRWGSSRGGG